MVYVNRRAGATTGAWPGTQTLLRLEVERLDRQGRARAPYYLPQFMREQSRTIVGLSSATSPPNIST